MIYDYENIRPMMGIVADELRSTEFESVLEVGCGYGENLLAIERIFKNKKIVGVDIDINRIEVARKHINAELIIGDINKLEFEDKSFDVAFTNALFCMISPEEVERGVKEIIRVAKKKLILIELNSDSKFGLVGRQRTSVNWKELFKEHGLEARLDKIGDIWNTSPWCSHGYKITIDL